MTIETIQSEVNTVISSEFEIPLEELKGDAHIRDDLGLDSLDAVDLLVGLEEKLGKSIDVQLFAEVKTLDDVYALVQKIAQEN